MAKLFIPRHRKPTLIQGRTEIELDVYNIIKRLHEIDPKLTCCWNESKGKWEIWRKAEDKDYLIFTVQNEDGSFRELDHRLIKRLKEIDTWHGADAAREADELDEKLEKETEENRKEIVAEELAPRLLHAIKKKNPDI